MLESGTARLLDLFRQIPRVTVALNAQRPRHHQRILRRGSLEQAGTPERPRTVLLEGTPVEARDIIWSCRLGTHRDASLWLLTAHSHIDTRGDPLSTP
jgi:hypothetical protein